MGAELLRAEVRRTPEMEERKERNELEWFRRVGASEEWRLRQSELKEREETRRQEPAQRARWGRAES